MENGHGGKACMENGGIRPEAKVTTVLVRSKNMAIAAAVNTETPMSNKTPAMRDFLNMVSIIAMETPSPCVRSTHLLRERVVPYGDPNDPHYRKNAFDAGEDGLGKNAHFLKKVKNITRFK